MNPAPPLFYVQVQELMLSAQTPVCRHCGGPTVFIEWSPFAAGRARFDCTMEQCDLTTWADVPPPPLDAVAALLEEVDRLHNLVHRPSIVRFAESVVLEAAHQVERWGVEHDAGKEPEDWFWLVGYLAGKALRACHDGVVDKALHHCISTAAVLANWHAAVQSGDTRMRPGLSSHIPSAEPQSQT